MDLEENELEPAQELTAEELEGNNEDPSPAADAVPKEIDQDFHPVTQEMAESETGCGEMQPGDYMAERPGRNRRPPSSLNYATLGNPYVSSLQAFNDSVFNPSTSLY